LSVSQRNGTGFFRSCTRDAKCNSKDKPANGRNEDMGTSSSTASNASTTTTKTTTTMGQQPITRPMGKSTPKGKPLQGLTKYGCWNIRRGLIKHETEIKQLLYEEKMIIMFL
jgi:hypothetical protein